MNAASRARARQALDHKLQGLRDTPLGRPPRGWIRAVRTALGMSLAEVGRAMGVSHQAVAQLERSEQEGTISLGKLEEVAEALGCRVEYALVSVEPLGHRAQQQDLSALLASVERTRHNMALEGEVAPDALSELSALEAVAAGDPDTVQQVAEALGEERLRELLNPGAAGESGRS